MSRTSIQSPIVYMCRDVNDIQFTAGNVDRWPIARLRENGFYVAHILAAVNRSRVVRSRGDFSRRLAHYRRAQQTQVVGIFVRRPVYLFPSKPFSAHNHHIKRSRMISAKQNGKSRPRLFGNISAYYVTTYNPSEYVCFGSFFIALIVYERSTERRANCRAV